MHPCRSQPLPSPPFHPFRPKNSENSEGQTSLSHMKSRSGKMQLLLLLPSRFSMADQDEQGGPRGPGQNPNAALEQSNAHLQG